MGRGHRKSRALKALQVSFVVCLVGAGVITCTGTAAAGLPAAVEAFTIEGTWGCTATCSSSSWTLSGTSGGGVTVDGKNLSCMENEGELEDYDVHVVNPCTATLDGQIHHQMCTSGVCKDYGVLTLAVKDPSDPGYTIPLVVVVNGAVANEDAYDPSLEYVAADGFADELWVFYLDEGYPKLLWQGTGVLRPTACVQATGTVPVSCAWSAGTFYIHVTGVEVDV